MYKEKTGLMLRANGESQAEADASGISGKFISELALIRFQGQKMKNLKLLAFCLMLLPFAAPMLPAAGSGQVQITLMQLAKTDGNVIFTIVVKNTGTELVYAIQVTLEGESLFYLTTPSEGLQPGESTCDAYGLAGDYTVGESYPVNITVTLSDQTVAIPAQSVTCTAGSTRNVGVHPGDWFKYNITIGGNGTVPPSLAAVDWILVQVTSVSGTNVTERATFHWRDVTEMPPPADYWVDVNTGEGDGAAWGDFIAADLGVGDAVYTNLTSKYAPVVTAIEPKAYPDGARETNYAIDNQGVDCYDCYYWDRSTGARVEHLYSSRGQEGANTIIQTIQYTLVDSGVWVVPEFPVWAPLLALFAAFTLVAVAYKRKQLKTPTATKKAG